MYIFWIAWEPYESLNFSNLNISELDLSFFQKVVPTVALHHVSHLGRTSHFWWSNHPGAGLAHSISRISSNNVEFEAIYIQLLDLKKRKRKVLT